MRVFGYLTLLIFSVLLQIAWGPWLSLWGFSLPLVLILLLIGTRWFEASTLLIFAFLTGFFSDLLGVGNLGLMAFFNTVVIGAVLFINRKQ